MKTTVELPDELMRAIKVKAAREDRKLKDLVAELLERALTDAERAPIRHRVKLPLITGGRPDVHGEMSPERVAEILLEDEVSSLIP